MNRTSDWRGRNPGRRSVFLVPVAAIAADTPLSIRHLGNPGANARCESRDEGATHIDVFRKNEGCLLQVLLSFSSPSTGDKEHNGKKNANTGAKDADGDLSRSEYSPL